MTLPLTLVGTQALHPDPSLNRLIFRGTKLTGDLRDAVINADVSLSVSEVTELSLSLEDPNFALLGTGLFSLGTSVVYEDMKLEVAAVETYGGGSGNGGLNITARSAIIGALKRRRGARVMRNSSPSDFVISEARAVGATYYVQPSAKRTQVSRDVQKSGQPLGVDIPSSWTTFQRLASELGYYVFEAAGVICFGKPSWLLTNAFPHTDPVKVTWNRDQEFFRSNEPPACRRSSDSTDGTYVTFSVPLSRAGEFRPGRRMSLGGVPTFDATYLVTSVRFSLAGAGVIDVECKTPIDPKPQPPQTATTTSVASKTKASAATPKTGGATKSSLDFVNLALRQSGKRYIFGVEANPNNPNPTAFDCSELVEWACRRVGVYIPDGSANQRAYCQSKGTMITVAQAAKVRGALLFHPGHVAISLGNGRTIEAMNERLGVRQGGVFGRSDAFTSAARVPGLRY